MTYRACNRRIDIARPLPCQLTGSRVQRVCRRTGYKSNRNSKLALQRIFTSSTGKRHCVLGGSWRINGPQMSTSPTRLVKLDGLMQRSTGEKEIVIGLIDGPVAMGHPDLARGKIRFTGTAGAVCNLSGSFACQHGTFVAGILSAREAPRHPQSSRISEGANPNAARAVAHRDGTRQTQAH